MHYALSTTMKKTLTALLMAAAVAMGATAQEQLLAFPGAEGFGRFAKGGRGGEIYHVTNLNDEGAGSFRDAVSRTGRIIVFDVSGVIQLKSALVVKGNNTILGQTAPGEGVQVYGNRVSFSGADNLIVRHMRFRMGTKGDSGKDACGIANGENMIFDHISALWGRDENFSVNWDKKGVRPGNITIQNSIIGQGLQSHSCGGLIQTDGGVTLYRNLYIENKTRNPKVKGLNQYVNNVVYNWGEGGCYIMGDTEGASWAHIENNYFMRGPWQGATQPFTRGSEAFHYYGAGNYYDDNKDGVINGSLLTVEQMNGLQGDGRHSTWVESLEALNNKVIHEVIHEGSGSSINYDVIVSEQDRTIPAQIPAISNTMSAADAYAWIAQYVGPSLPARDEVDQYIIDELLTYGTDGTKGGISQESQLPHKGTGTLSGGKKPLDTDNDGIPDEWETANGLNPNDPSDAAAIAANGYANIENYSFTITEAYPYIKKPVSLEVTRTDKTEIGLQWDLNKNTECGFIIEISTDKGVTYTEAARVAAGTSTHTLTGLTPETDYSVRVYSFNDNGIVSDYSNVVATETTGDPAAPKLSVNPFPADGAKQGIGGGLTLTWENPSKEYGGTVRYVVYLGTDKENLPAVSPFLTEKQYVTEGLEAGKTYYWRVDATNEMGTTTGTVWSFSTTAGGVLFYTDFHTQPAGWAEKYGNIADNTNILNAANKTVEVGGMTFGTGDKAVRIIAMSGANNASSSSQDYGPDTADDEGATDRCVQFYTTAAGGYVTTPEVNGPCVITLYIGNPDKKGKTVKLNTIAGGTEQTVQELTLPARKRVYKFTYTYMTNGPVVFKVDNNAVKFNINDILIERYVTPSGNDPLELTSGSLDNQITYADGSIALTFNQDIVYDGSATVSGKTQWENIKVSASGKKLNISYEALNVNSEYTVSFPEGAIKDIKGEQSFPATVKLTTGDFGPAKQSGETHYGKAAKTLPMNFAPFDAVAPFETVGGLTQSSQKDYPHWVQASGDITADAAVMTSTNDKLMTYFDPQSKAVALSIEYEGEGNPLLKIQESRNCDVDPGWRTIRVLEKSDFPFRGELPLNAETRMVKVVPTTIGGTITVKEMRISDAAGYFGEDYVGIAGITVDNVNVSAEGIDIHVNGLTDGTSVVVYDLTGRTVATAVAAGSEATVSLAHGVYIVNIPGVKAVKIKL